MSQEPPRVNFPGPGFPGQTTGHTAGRFPGQLPGGRPKGNPGRVVAIVLGILFSILFLCSGAAVVAYRSFNADSNFGGKFEELHDSTGGAIPDKTREIAQRAGAVETNEAEEVADWLESFPKIDKSRMVMEMQRSGLSNGAVNPLTRIRWLLNLEDALEPLDLGNQVAVLDFEWLVKNKEARVVVASLTNYRNEDGDGVYVLYINRQDDQWNLFDWRDVLLPMSEAQYWAVYAGLEEPKDRTFADFTNTLYNTYVNQSMTQPEKIRRSMTTYKSTKFPNQYKALAQDFLCSWLISYDAKEELAEMVKQLSADEFAGAWLYKAQSAAWSNDIDSAFQYLGELSKQVGWHPRAAQLAAEVARTPEQKHLAAEWLQRSVLLAPVSHSDSNDFFKLADRQQMESLFQQIAKTKRPSSQAIKLFESVGYLQERQIQVLADLTQPIAELQEAHRYLEYKKAVVKEDFAEVVNLAPQILQRKSLQDEPNESDNYSLWNEYLTAAAKTNSLMQAAEQTPDRDQFLTQLRDRATNSYFELPAKETAAILKSIPDDHELREDIQTPIAIANLDIKLNKASEAFDSLLESFKENESAITDEEPAEFAYPLLRTLGQAAVASGRWRELSEVIDAEVLFLMLCGSEEIKPDQLQQVLEWYEGVPNHAKLWPKYFRAHLAFESGDWTAADGLIVEAIRLAKQDLRATEGTLNPLVAMLDASGEYDEYDDYESDIASKWITVRMSYATRCNALDRLVSEAQIKDELDATWVGWISEHYSMASIESQEKIAAMLRASSLSEAQELAEEIRGSLLDERGQLDEAFDKSVNRAQGMERNSFEQRFAVTSAGWRLLRSGDKRRIESLRQVSRGTDVEAYVDCIAATLDGDVPALCNALKRWKAVGQPYQDFVNIDVLKRLQGSPNLRDITAVQPINSTLLRYSCDDRTLVLAADATQAAITFEDFLKSNAISYTVLETSRFDQAVAALEIKTENGECFMIFKSTNEDALLKNDLTETFAKDARSFAICVRKESDMGQSNSSEIALRTTINDLLGGLPTALALYEEVTSSLFCGAGWQQRFGESLKTGIDVAHPMEYYGLLAQEDSKWFLERDGQSFVVLSQARELVPVKLQPQESAWLDEVGVTAAPSILIPCLSADMMLTIDRY